MAEVIESVVSPSDPKYHTDYYWRRLETLDWNLKHLPVTPEDSKLPLPKSDGSIFIIAKLYQLAALIYIVRASTDRSGQSDKLRRLLDDALSTLEGLQTCPWSLPLLLIGCEAQSDEHRLTILELIHRTGKLTYMGNLGCLKIVFRISWIQDDLAQCDLSYMDKLTRLMSLTDNAPTLA
jgi:hypothetical protein